MPTLHAIGDESFLRSAVFLDEVEPMKDAPRAPASAGALITPSEDDTLSQLLASMCKAGTKMSGVHCSGRDKRSYKGDPALTQVHNHIRNLIASR